MTRSKGVRRVSVWVPEGPRISVALHAVRVPPSRIAIVLGHGAGSDMDHPALVHTAKALAERGHITARFNFPYRDRGAKLPDKGPVLEACYRNVAEMMRRQEFVERLVLGGRSMGGRIATLLAADGFPCDGILLFGYPLHPAGNKARLRDEHLPRIRAPMLFVQGSRDDLCDLSLLRPILEPLSHRATLHVVEGADHGLDVRKSSGRTSKEVHEEIVSVADDWLKARVADDAT